MNFASDNTAPVAPASKEAVVALEQIALRCRPELFSQDLERHIAAAPPIITSQTKR